MVRRLIIGSRRSRVSVFHVVIHFLLAIHLVVTVQGMSIGVPSNNSLAAIDAGTTLIGAPSSISKQIRANVPGYVALDSPNEGMYAYRRYSCITHCMALMQSVCCAACTTTSASLYRSVVLTGLSTPPT